MYTITVKKSVKLSNQQKEILQQYKFVETDEAYILKLGDEDEEKYSGTCKTLLTRKIPFNAMEEDEDLTEDEEDQMEMSASTKNPQKPSQHKLVANPEKANNLKKFTDQNRKPTQRSVSIYHSIHSESLDKDKTYYVRNQDKHPFSNIKNSKGATPNQLNPHLSADYFIKSSKNYHFGVDPSFGHEFNHKTPSSGNAINKPKTDSRAVQALQALVDTVLEHKNAAVEEIVKAFHDEEKPIELNSIIIDKNQLAAKYPCLIIRLNDVYPPHKAMKEKGTTNEYDEAYTNLLTHLLIACINTELYKHNVGVFFDKRQSFGFLSPTASDVNAAIRLSLGLVPNEEWKQCVIQGIQNFDKLVNRLWEQKAIRPGKVGMGEPQSKFNHGDIDIYGHKLFLPKLIKGEQELIDFVKSINDISYMQITKAAQMPGYFEALSNTLAKLETAPVDGNFRILFSQIYSLFNDLNNEELTEIDFNKKVTELMHELDDAIDTYRRNSAREVSELEEIDMTSESSSDGEDYEKSKHYSAAGMSSLLYPMFAVANIAFAGKSSIKKIDYKIEPYAYFELRSMVLSKKKFNAINDYSSAFVVYADNNPCVNAAAPPVPVAQTIANFSKAIKPSTIPQMLVIDITSATQEQIDNIMQQWSQSNIPLLCLAKSGVKNMQFSLDLAQYGENRLFTNKAYIERLSNHNKETAKNLAHNCDLVATELEKISQGTSSVYSTYVRRQLRSKYLEAGMEQTMNVNAPSTVPTTSNHGKRSADKMIGGFERLYQLTLSWEYNLGLTYEQALKHAIAKSTSKQHNKKTTSEELGDVASHYGLQCEDVDRDGNCFFHAVATQLKQRLGLDVSHDDLRRLAISHILENADLYKDFFKDQEVDTFIEDNIHEGQWADHAMILAIAREFDINIAIVRSDDAEPTIIRTNPDLGKTIYLGYEVGLHYQSTKGNPAANIIETITQTEQDEAGHFQRVLHDLQRSIITIPETALVKEKMVSQPQKAIERGVLEINSMKTEIQLINLFLQKIKENKFLMQSSQELAEKCTKFLGKFQSFSANLKEYDEPTALKVIHKLKETSLFLAKDINSFCEQRKINLGRSITIGSPTVSTKPLTQESQQMDLSNQREPGIDEQPKSNQAAKTRFMK